MTINLNAALLQLGLALDDTREAVAIAEAFTAAADDANDRLRAALRHQDKYVAAVLVAALTPFAGVAT
jgi:hypothetical protein